MSNRNITNKFLGTIGGSKFHWDPSEMFPEDKSYLTNAFGYDGNPKKCMSFWLSNSPWEWDDEEHDYVIHYHCYPDNGNECYNPTICFPKGLSNKEKIKILIDFLKRKCHWHK